MKTHSGGILQWFFYFCLLQEDVTSTSSPQHTLKLGQALTADYTSNKPVKPEDDMFQLETSQL